MPHFSTTSPLLLSVFHSSAQCPGVSKPALPAAPAAALAESNGLRWHLGNSSTKVLFGHPSQSQYICTARGKLPASPAIFSGDCCFYVRCEPLDRRL